MLKFLWGALLPRQVLVGVGDVGGNHLYISTKNIFLKTISIFTKKII